MCACACVPIWAMRMCVCELSVLVSFSGVQMHITPIASAYVTLRPSACACAWARVSKGLICRMWPTKPNHSRQ